MRCLGIRSNCHQAARLGHARCFVHFIPGAWATLSNTYAVWGSLLLGVRVMVWCRCASVLSALASLLVPLCGHPLGVLMFRRGCDCLLLFVVP